MQSTFSIYSGCHNQNCTQCVTYNLRPKGECGGEALEWKGVQNLCLTSNLALQLCSVIPTFILEHPETKKWKPWIFMSFQHNICYILYLLDENIITWKNLCLWDLRLRCWVVSARCTTPIALEEPWTLPAPRNSLVPATSSSPNEGWVSCQGQKQANELILWIQQTDTDKIYSTS